jgi:hypothetical protein
MRRPLLIPVCVLALAACSDTNSPTIYSTAGAWRSRDFAPASVVVTLVETARSTSGAGRWSTAADANAFRVTGAHSDSTVSLLFDFDGREDITFEGKFRRQDVGSDNVIVMAGRLYGGEFHGEDFVLEPDEDLTP